MAEQPKILPLNVLREAPNTSCKKFDLSLAGSELLFMRNRLADALEAHPEGNISRCGMLNVFVVDRIKQAISYEWQYQGCSGIWPGMAEAEFKRAIKEESGMKNFHLRIKLWEFLRTLVSDDGPELSGWMIRCEDKNGEAAVQLRWREDFKSGWADDIVLTLDATFSSELVAPYFARPLEILPCADAKLEHVSVLQVIDCSFAATSIIPTGDNDDKRRENRAREVWRWVWLRSIEFRGKGRDGIDVLILCQLGLERLFRDWGLPDKVDIAHFNDIRGLDQWGGVRCLVSAGRVSPKPSDVEDIAETLTGSAVTEKVKHGEWYPKETVGIRLADGTGWPVENDRHPDPVAEAVRHQICDGELIQAIGRGRAVNRSEGWPLQIDILTNVCLPLIVNQPILWKDAAPGKVDEMICRGLLPKSYSAAAQLYPDLWSSEDAARKAASRRLRETEAEALKPDISLIIYSIWGMSGLSRLFDLNLISGLATICGKTRSQTLPFLFDPAIIPSPGSWLSERYEANATVLIGSDAETEFQKRIL